MKNIFISILNFNGKNNTIECVESLKKINLSGISLTTIIIDNSSSDGSQAAILNIKNKIPTSPQGGSNIEIILNKKNLGFSGGHNVGIKYALDNGADYVLLLNNDTYVDNFFLYELLKASEKDDKIGILSPKIFFTPGFEFHKDRYEKEFLGKVIWYAGGEMDWSNVIGHHRGVDEIDHGQFDETTETEYTTGCCMMIKRKVFEDIGMLDDKYFLYYEDIDFNIRAKKLGFKTIFVPSSIVWHKNAGSVGGSGSKLQDYYITRNRLLFGLRYSPMRAKFALLRESLKVLLTGRYWQKIGVLDFYLGKLGKGSFNV